MVIYFSVFFRFIYHYIYHRKNRKKIYNGNRISRIFCVRFAVKYVYYKVSIDCLYHLMSVLATSNNDIAKMLLSKQNLKKFISHIFL